MIASVTGRVIVNFVPVPSSDCTSITPPSREMFVFTTSMPTPRPERSVIAERVLKPGMKMRFSASSRLTSAAASSVISSRRRAVSTMRCGFMPAPSSSTSMTTCLPFW